MTLLKTYYVDCSIRIRSSKKGREPPVFAGRLWFDDFAEVVDFLEEKLLPSIAKLDRARILYRNSSGQYVQLVASEQDFVSECSRSTVVITYFADGKMPLAAYKAQTQALVHISPAPAPSSLLQIMAALKKTYATWVGTDSNWRILAKYYQERGLQGSETIAIPDSIASAFEDTSKRTVDLSPSLELTSVTESVPTTEAIPKIPEQDTPSAGITPDSPAPQPIPQQQILPPVDGVPPTVYYQYPQNYVPNCIPATGIPINQPPYAITPSRIDSLITLGLPKVSAKAACLITSIVYTDIQARETSNYAQFH